VRMLPQVDVRSGWIFYLGGIPPFVSRPPAPRQRRGLQDVTRSASARGRRPGASSLGGSGRGRSAARQSVVPILPSPPAMSSGPAAMLPLSGEDVRRRQIWLGKRPADAMPQGTAFSSLCILAVLCSFFLLVLTSSCLLLIL
jgi:hypothetical protein